MEYFYPPCTVDSSNLISSWMWLLQLNWQHVSQSCVIWFCSTVHRGLIMNYDISLSICKLSAMVKTQYCFFEALNCETSKNLQIRRKFLQSQGGGHFNGHVLPLKLLSAWTFLIHDVTIKHYLRSFSFRTWRTCCRLPEAADEGICRRRFIDSPWLRCVSPTSGYC